MVIDIILREMEDLPEDRRQEVLDFIRFLKWRRGQEQAETALLSEPALQQDWLRPEEDQAWRDL